MSHPFDKVVIVGAGPAGLLLGLLLSREGISVDILEASHELNTQPRAAYYGPAAIPDLKRAEILDEIRRRGLSPSFMSWRRWGNFETIATLDGEVLNDVDGKDLRKACLPLNDLAHLILERFSAQPCGNIFWRHRVVNSGQDENRAWVDVEVDEAGLKVQKRIYGDYVVGCDGGRSAVRKSLFGENFPGFTWVKQIVATNIKYDFFKHGFRDLTLVIHPDHFYLVAKLSLDGLYRVTYGETPGYTLEEMRARLPLKFEMILPGHPRPEDYEVVNMAPYKIHQRCAPSFREGRVLLAGDAAHLCNPWGGLGITGGFVDVGGLYECLAGIWHGKADESILDVYSEKRIAAYRTVIDPASQGNFRRTTDSNSATLLDRDPFLQACKRGESDEALRKKLLLSSLDIRYDFTQHYR
ncbi:FAD binding domain-containing protein [Xylariaceae sp. AK1471]|nr:FAD binding domain-containing protein [Xylariaceae sp. AK1471]